MAKDVQIQEIVNISTMSVFVNDVKNHFYYHAPAYSSLLGSYVNSSGFLYLTIKNVLEPDLAKLFLSLNGINSIFHELCLNRTVDISYLELRACLTKLFKIVTSTVGKCDDNLEISIKLEVLDINAIEEDITSDSLAGYLGYLIEEVTDDLLLSDFKITSSNHNPANIKFVKRSERNNLKELFENGIHLLSTNVYLKTIFKASIIKSSRFGYPYTGYTDEAIIERSNVIQLRNVKLGFIRYRLINCFWDENRLDLYSDYFHDSGVFSSMTYKVESADKIVVDLFFPEEWQFKTLFEVLKGFEDMMKPRLNSYRCHADKTAANRYKESIKVVE